MRIYIAAPWVEKEAAEAASLLFQAAGHTITKKWWEHREVEGYLAHEHDNGELRRQAWQDLDGVAACDIFVLLNLSKSEGKAVETGYALALNESGCHDITMILVGGRSNLFHYLSEWTIVESVEDAIGQIN